MSTAAPNNVPNIPWLSPAANLALAQGDTLPAPMQGFVLRIEPGEVQHCDNYGNFYYVATADQPLEIAVNDGQNFFPWDAAMAVEMGREAAFRRISVKNVGQGRLVGMLYTGFAKITDHRLHQIGETKMTVTNQAGSVYENTFGLVDTAWHTLAAPWAGKREVWLAAERADGTTAPVKAYWRANSGDGAQVPAREIGLALDGITRLPLSDRIDVSTSEAPGVCRVRYWIVSFVDAGSEPPGQNEQLIIPQLSSFEDFAANGLTATSTTNYGDLWKLFDRDIGSPAGEYNCMASGDNWWSCTIGLGAQRSLSRLALKWNSFDLTYATKSPHFIRFYVSNDGANWNQLVSNNENGLCTYPAAPGQVIFTRAFMEDEAPARFVHLAVLRPWQHGAGAHDTRMAELELYTRQPL